MKKKYTAGGLLMVVSISLVLSCGKKEEKEAVRPNILFIMSDDHAFQAISAYDTMLIHTPNIDRIANQGAILTQGFVTNAICAPSRAAILTGKHSFINGKVDNVQPFNWDQENFPKILQRNGYQTALIGKIHLDGQPQGFDHSAVLKGQGHYYAPEFVIDGEEKQITGYITDILSDMALDWLKGRDKTKPFCMLYHHKAPHREWLPAPRYHKEYIHKTFPEPPNLFDDYSGRGTAAKTAEMNILKHMNWAGDSKIYPEVMDELGLSGFLGWGKAALQDELDRMTPEERAAWDATYIPMNEQFKKEYPNMSQEDLMHWRYQRYMQDYLGSVAGVDEAVGEVLDYLDESGLAENTIVIYTSDQGFFLAEHGWFDKRFMYEESFRTPMLIRYPQEIKPGTKINQLIQNIDFAPTLLDYAGIEVPADMQGESFRKIADGESTEWRDALYYTYYQYPSIHQVKRHYGVRTDRYKLIHFYYDVDEWELYDLQEDPHEMKSVYNDPAYADVQQKLHQRLKELRAQYGDSDENDQRFLKAYLEHEEKAKAAAEKKKQEKEAEEKKQQEAAH